jgi:hypothetical protein
MALRKMLTNKASRVHIVAQQRRSYIAVSSTASSLSFQQNQKRNELSCFNHFVKGTQNHQQNQQNRYLATANSAASSTPRVSFVPQKAPVKMTPKARKFFKGLLAHNMESNKETIGIMLRYRQSQTGEPRMVFTFDFVTQNQISDKDEPVSLELVESIGSDGEKEETPKLPQDSYDDGLPKLFIHEHAFMKVLGCTIDINTLDLTPVLYDREGNLCDPNA